MIEIAPLPGIGEVHAGDVLAPILLAALERADVSLRDGDVLVITQKVVSKVEGRFVALADVVPSVAAQGLAKTTGKDARLVELALQESVKVVRAVPGVLITRHRLGFVMANAGIDQSNIGPGREASVLLLPEDPDASARRIAEALRAACGAAIGVVISDSFGRPWRYGVVNVAIGAFGFQTLHDRRGERDRDGRALEVTQVATADLIASAAGLAAGEGAEGVPAVLVRGVRLAPGAANAAALIRSEKEDLFL